MRKNAGSKPKPISPDAVKRDDKPQKSFSKKGSFWDTDRNDDGTAGNFVPKKKGAAKNEIVEKISDYKKKIEQFKVTNFNPHGTPRKNELEETEQEKNLKLKTAAEKPESEEAAKAPKRAYEPRKFTRRPVKISEEEAEKKPRNPGIKKTNEHTRRRPSDLAKPGTKKFDKPAGKKTDKPAAKKAGSPKKPGRK